MQFFNFLNDVSLFNDVSFVVYTLPIKIIRSVVLVGLYYGFLSTLSIGPSSFFLLRYCVMEYDENEKQLAATTGFLMGQLMMFVSIYYVPLHLALWRPHTMTCVTVPYLLVHFFWHNHKDWDCFYFDESTNRKSIRNFSIQCIFLNSLIFQFCNHFLWPNSTLTRLITIYMFRSKTKNQMLFLTSSLFGWLIGQFLFLKLLRLGVVWLQKYQSFRSNKLIRAKNYKRARWYLGSQWSNYTGQIFSVLLFTTCLYYLVKIPSPLFSIKLKNLQIMKEIEKEPYWITTIMGKMFGKRIESRILEENPKHDKTTEKKLKKKVFNFVKMVKLFESDIMKRELCESNLRHQDPDFWDNPILRNKGEFTLASLRELKNPSFFSDKPLLSFLFDSNRWNRPLRYTVPESLRDSELWSKFFVEKKPDPNKKKPVNPNLEEKKRKKTGVLVPVDVPGAVRNDTGMSQYCFELTTRMDGETRFSFTYPPALSSWFETLILKQESILKIPPPDPEVKKFDRDYGYLIVQDVFNRKGDNFKRQFEERIKILNKNFYYKNLLFAFERFMFWKRFSTWNILEIKPRFCNRRIAGSSYKQYFPQKYDPLNRSSRRHRFLTKRTEVWARKKRRKFQPKYNRLNLFLLAAQAYKVMDQLYNTLITIQRTTITKPLFQLIHRFIRGKKGQMSVINTEIPRSEIEIMNSSLILKLFVKEDLETIQKQVPRALYKFITEPEQYSPKYLRKRNPTDFQILEGEYDTETVFSLPPKHLLKDKISHFIRKTLQRNVRLDQDLTVSYFDFDEIKGSMLSHTRKTIMDQLYQPHVRGGIFIDQEDPNDFVFYTMKFINWVLERLNIVDRPRYAALEERSGELEEKGQITSKVEEVTLTPEDQKMERIEIWELYPGGLGLRACILLVISFFRKKILIPFWIIVKNIGRMLLFQTPEWSEDFRKLKKELHVICLPSGIPSAGISIVGISQKKAPLPKEWYYDGLQIRILFPFSFSRSQRRHKDSRDETDTDFGYLTIWGDGSETPYGKGLKRPPIFQPLLRDFKKRSIFLIKKYFIILKTKTKFFRKLFKKIKKKAKEAKEKDSKQVFDKAVSELDSSDPNWTNYSFTEQQTKILTNKRNQTLELMPKKRNYNYNATRLIHEKCKILKRINFRIICKLPLFLKVFIARIYKDRFLRSINILKKIKNIELFLSRQAKRIHKKKKPTPFISTREEALTLKNIANRRTNSHNFDDLSYVSQAYVFYTLAKIQVSNLYKFRSFLHSQGIPLFLKPEIKDSFETRGVVHSKWGDKKLPSYEMNQWKNWLRGHDQYNLPEIRWARLIPKKWRNTIHQRHIAKKENLCKWHSYEKDQLIDYKKEKQLQGYSFFNNKSFAFLNKKFNQHKNLKKAYRYDLLAYKFINYENKAECFFDRSPFQGNKNQEISSYTAKDSILWNKLREMPITIPHYLDINLDINLGVDTLYRFREKTSDRKYFDWKIVDFYPRPNVRIRHKVKNVMQKGPALMQKGPPEALQKNPVEKYRDQKKQRKREKLKQLKKKDKNLREEIIETKRKQLLQEKIKKKIQQLRERKNKRQIRQKLIDNKRQIRQKLIDNKRQKLRKKLREIKKKKGRHIIPKLIKLIKKKKKEVIKKRLELIKKIKLELIELIKTELIKQKKPEVKQKKPEVKQKKPEVKQEEPEVKKKKPEVKQTKIKKLIKLIQKIQKEIQKNEPEIIQIGPEVGDIKTYSRLQIKKKQKTKRNRKKNSLNFPKGFFDWMGMNEKMLSHSIFNLEPWFFPEFVLLYNAYKKKPWFIPHRFLFKNWTIKKNHVAAIKQKIRKKEIKRHNEDLEYPIEFFIKQKHKKKVKPPCLKLKARIAAQALGKAQTKLTDYQKPWVIFQGNHHFRDSVLAKSNRLLFLYSTLLNFRDENKCNKFLRSSIYKREFNLEIQTIPSKRRPRITPKVTPEVTPDEVTPEVPPEVPPKTRRHKTPSELIHELKELREHGLLEIEPFRIRKNKGRFLMYQTIGLSLIQKSKLETNQKYQEKRDLAQRSLSNNHFDEAISTHQRIITENRDRDRFELLVPENILSFRGRRKLRIFRCLDMRRKRRLEAQKRNDIDRRNPAFLNEKNKKNNTQVSHDNKHLDRDKNKLMKLKLFLWPNYRLEDLACMNRYWFDTYNGSRFSMLRILLYPRL